MRLIDITRALGRETPPYPGDVAFAAEIATTIGQSGSNTRRLTLSSHAGTHVDAPRHFFDEGRALGDLPLERFFLPARVVAVGDDGDDGGGGAAGRIRRAHLTEIETAAGEALLLKTRNALLPFDRFSEQSVHLAVDAAEWIVERGVSLLGIDYYSVDAYGDARQPAHHVLLGAGVLVLENIDLRGVAPGRYRLACFPLKFADADASPCRAALIEISGD